MITPDYYVACAIALYIIGMYCLASKRNMIKLVMGLEILVNASHLCFIAFSAYRQPGFIDPLGHNIVVISIGLAGCITAVALSLVIYAYKHYKTLDVRKLRRLKW
ncbi:MAG: NADH-quinone oxidoreductase subunit NuoK [Candidatus Bathyarchaeota archaeon]|jgi:NADH-quinone oxidoreductase subunit K